MMYSKLKGTGIAIITPFKDDLSIDYASLGELINHLIDNNVDYIVCMGTTGESVTLTKEEKKELLAFTKHEIDGRIPLVVGIGGNNTAEIVSTIQQFDFSGIDCILSVSPYYNKPTQKGIYNHYNTIAEAAPLPVIIYNVPSRTGSNITADTTLKIAHEIENIIGVKEASGDLIQCMKIVYEKPDDFLVISGDDGLTLPMISFGMDGVISVIGNAFPMEFSQMVNDALSGNFTKSSKIHLKLLNMMELIFREGSPGGIKAVLNIMGVCKNVVRPPLEKISNELYTKIKVEMEKFESVENSS